MVAFFRGQSRIAEEEVPHQKCMIMRQPSKEKWNTPPPPNIEPYFNTDYCLKGIELNLQCLSMWIHATSKKFHEMPGCTNFVFLYLQPLLLQDHTYNVVFYIQAANKKDH